MAYEPSMPTREKIWEKALEFFMEEWTVTHPDIPSPTPEEYELREGNYWLRAQRDLMAGVRSELEGYLSYLESEAEKIRDELGVKPPEELEEMRDRIERLEDRLETSKEKLRRAREREKELKAEIERVAREKERVIKEKEEEIEVAKAIRMMMVRFDKDIPSFVGVDMKIYGPFKSGEVASIPEGNAGILIEKGVVKPWVAVVTPPTPPLKPKVPEWKICPIHKIEMEKVPFIPVYTEALEEVEPEVSEWMKKRWEVRAVPVKPPKPTVVNTIKVPETIEIYWCPEGDHWFERVDAKTRERSLAFLLRKIEREGRRLERMITPPRPPPTLPSWEDWERGRVRVEEEWEGPHVIRLEDWVRQVLRMRMTEFDALPVEQIERYVKQYIEEITRRG